MGEGRSEREFLHVEEERERESGGESGRSERGIPEVSHLGWGHWYTLREIEEATGGLAEENVIGEGGYGIVYRGVLADGTVVAAKNLLNNRSLLSLSKFFLPRSNFFGYI